MVDTATLKRVGGRIFFIDPKSTECVRFYDENGKEIKSVKAGDMPFYYKVTRKKKGESPKFWVYNANIANWRRWMPFSAKYKKHDTVTSFGSGFFNTDTIMHETDYSKDEDTIWGELRKRNEQSEFGCNDWFVPSKDEALVMRDFFKEAKATLGLVDPFDLTWLWVSSESSSTNAWYWDCSSQDFSSNSKDSNFSVLFVRAF